MNPVLNWDYVGMFQGIARMWYDIKVFLSTSHLPVDVITGIALLILLDVCK